MRAHLSPTVQLSLLPPHGERMRVNPVCAYDHCRRGGVAYLGAPVAYAGCVNRPITCDRCGATGEQSTRTDAVPA